MSYKVLSSIYIHQYFTQIPILTLSSLLSSPSSTYPAISLLSTPTPLYISLSTHPIITSSLFTLLFLLLLFNLHQYFSFVCPFLFLHLLSTLISLTSPNLLFNLLSLFCSNCSYFLPHLLYNAYILSKQLQKREHGLILWVAQDREPRRSDFGWGDKRTLDLTPVVVLGL
jgi:hypothetical protein